ncbi:TetR/AcrR family transcriptional regulator [Nocardioides pantholopis]|uniref:TetR/AcrR family transcriptional regulator n=1 Tax=Nocardioides pantholopis TaxID=2483798 RepID=UPI001F150B23|nr:TetR/AcrR family transcriptional regulator [Nocardioides pantholopis]
MSASPAPDDGAPDGRAARWAGQHERRRAEFVDAALAAIAEHGPDVSTEQIAQRAGVARTRLYKHFSGAGELNRAIAARAVELVSAELTPLWEASGTPREIIEGTVVAHLGFLTEHRNLYRYLVRHSASGAMDGHDAVTDIKGAIAGHLTGLFAEFLNAAGAEIGLAEPLSHGLVGFVDAAANRWVDSPGSLPLEQMTEFVSGSIWAILEHQLRAVGLQIELDEPLFG